MDQSSEGNAMLLCDLTQTVSKLDGVVSESRLTGFDFSFHQLDLGLRGFLFGWGRLDDFRFRFSFCHGDRFCFGSVSFFLLRLCRSRFCPGNSGSLFRTCGLSLFRFFNFGFDQNPFGSRGRQGRQNKPTHRQCRSADFRQCCWLSSVTPERCHAGWRSE